MTKATLELITAKLLLREPDYSLAKLKSAEIDALLGFDYGPIEERLERENPRPTLADQDQRWLGLPTQTLLTPYSELVEIVAELQPQADSTWVDLGAAYGRLGIVLGLLRPEVRFIGYELVPERVLAGQEVMTRFGLKRSSLAVADLSDQGFIPTEAELYFLYDFGTRAAIEKTVMDMRTIARRRKITVVARGRGVRQLIERAHPWLAEVVPPVRRANYTIYRSAV